ncbi:hypothetical protein H0H93_011889 [Arthromyces matolae]|nr:hypothetical protein H0H93_011889 [Arthromyces matolae]
MLPAFQSLPLPLAQLSLAAVLKCGQSFRWKTVPLVNPDDTEYRLCLRDRVPTPTQTALREAETLLWLKDYFQLDIDLAALYIEWSARDPVFARMQTRFQGIRILRQDPWENLISFICSSNNNISRISKMIHALCNHYSKPLLSFPQEETSYCPFPPPSVLAEPNVTATLRSLGFGYRADFIHRTAKMLVNAHGGPLNQVDSEPAEKWLMGLRDVATDEARNELLQFVGVGRKVADCVLLMSLDKKEVVPVDTHVYQIATKHYGLRSKSDGKKVNMTPKLYEELNSKFFNVWGHYAGWAHSVLFTADLKSFASYGLITPQGPPPESKNASRNVMPTPPLTPSRSPLKRAHDTDIEDNTVELELDIACGLESSLAERVKRRRRIRL